MRATPMVLGAILASCAASHPSSTPPPTTTRAPETAAPEARSASPTPHVPAVVAGPRVVQIAAAADRACALLDDTTVRCWGSNANGELGDGTDELRAKPTPLVDAPDLALNEVYERPPPPPLRNVAQVVLGRSHGCARLVDGTVRCWGRNERGGAGVTLPYSIYTPRKVPNLSGVAEIAAGGAETCARLNDGTVHCFMLFGRLDVPGRRKRGEVEARVQRAIVGIGDAIRIAVGSDSAACAIRRDGSVWCWTGDAPPAAIPGIAGATDLMLGGPASCARVTSGIVCWKGKLGDAQDLENVTSASLGEGIPCVVAGGRVSCRRGSTWKAVEGLGAERAIVTGAHHACALRADGTVRCFGATEFGQLGDGSAKERTWAAKALGVARATRLFVGASTACAGSDRATWCWGTSIKDLFEPKGNHTTTPTEVAPLRDARSVGVGDGDLCAVRAGGSVECWGEHTEKGEVAGVNGALDVALGNVFFCARGGADIRCWGYGSAGVLGRAPSEDFLPPAPVPGIASPLRIGAGAGYACALTGAATRHLWCWGDKIYGRLGNGAPASTYPGASPHPSRVKIDDVSTFALGATHACALKRDGTAACWGLNKYGELGASDHESDTTEMLSTPVAVRGLVDATSIKVSDSATCALVRDGTVRCWGSNSYGELGDGTKQIRFRPTPVRGIEGVVEEIGMGEHYGCARTRQGEVWCWGENAWGQLGDGSPKERVTPVVVDMTR